MIVLFNVTVVRWKGARHSKRRGPRPQPGSSWYWPYETSKKMYCATGVWKSDPFSWREIFR
jgi:hypothetical protein